MAEQFRQDSFNVDNQFLFGLGLSKDSPAIANTEADY